MQPDESPIDRALNVIKPPPDRWDACRQEIETFIAMLRDLDAVIKGLWSPAKVKQGFGRVAKAVEKAVYEARKMPAFQLRYLEDYVPRWKEDAKYVKSLAESTKVPPGSRVWDDVKASCATLAEIYLLEYGHKPTRTEGGAFYTLASILYEAVTGKEEDLSQYCRSTGLFSDRYETK
jgi:hypothetical protein